MAISKIRWRIIKRESTEEANQLFVHTKQTKPKNRQRKELEDENRVL